ncbi:hypoxanthine phosphoribosyltransferase [Yasminevirus sp. GU-2018]|uniref:Hypoxanthine phosphoribosyltransferase n=1 Tax=Yasminevirus sp. GU-2018 TaxID=2420051 RepID=A0A5K0U7Y1_9VIRU|nr:hypoxanthine phosphoribosyltransferase [Yasminevirus sp. GU-2018]
MSTSTSASTFEVSHESHETQESHQSQPVFHNVSAEELQLFSLELAKKVYDSGFRPTFIIALWRGGTTTAMAVHEYFKFKDCDSDHIAVRTSSYVGTQQQKEIRVHGLGYIVEKANATDSVLIVDDIFDTGRSVAKVIEMMRERMRLNTPSNIRVATVFYKPLRTKVNFKPDYHCVETDDWVVFPHELEGLSKEQILKLKGERVYKLLME